VMFWNFSAYREQILWLPLLALGFSILSVYFYCRYLDSGRATADDLVISLLLFFVAVGTYSIQCGVPLAVFLLGLFRRPEATKGERLSATICGAIKDAAFFGILFVLFIQIWITTSAPMSGFFHLDPRFFLRHFLRSIAHLFWHSDTSDLIRSLNEHWPFWLLAGSVSVSAILFYFLFVFAGKEATPRSAGSCVPYLVLALAVFCALAMPTLLLESITAIWSPGTRSRMLQQGFQPVIYLSILFLLAEYLSRQRISRGVEHIRNGSIALLCGFGAVIGLEYNRQLSEQSMFELKLETGLKQVVPVLRQPTHFVVKMKGMKAGVWGSGLAWSMPSLFAQAAYNSNAVWLDPVYEGKPQAPDPVIFGSDEQGVYSPESGNTPGSGAWIPYRDVILLEFDGQKMTRLATH
jgi:hypothetical protein